MKAEQHARKMNDKVRNINEIIRPIQQRSVLPVKLLDVADIMEYSLPGDESSDGMVASTLIGPGGVEWLNGVFQRHIIILESEMLETAQFAFGPSPIPPISSTRPLYGRLEGRVDSRDSSRSSRTRQLGATPMEADEAGSSTTQSSVVSSVVVVDNRKAERPRETSFGEARYLERVKDLDLKDLACRQELAEILGLKNLSNEDLSRHHCGDWLNAHEAHFLRVRTLETAGLNGIPQK